LGVERFALGVEFGKRAMQIMYKLLVLFPEVARGREINPYDICASSFLRRLLVICPRRPARL
jgi:hypothetical protein